MHLECKNSVYEHIKSRQIQLWQIHLFFSPRANLLFTDDNSNQSSIADASPIKQENSSTSSPTPEQNSTGQADGPETKSEDTQADAKEDPGSEGEPSMWASLLL